MKGFRKAEYRKVMEKLRKAEQESADKELNEAKRFYPNGLCPDCSTEIPGNDKVGDACKNCGHVWTSG